MVIQSHQDHPTVLVTGSNGFTGVQLCNLLEQIGWHVYKGIQDEALQTDQLSISLESEASLLAALEQTKPDYIVHLAAVSFVGHGSPQQIYDINLLGTLNLLTAIDKSGLTPKKILLASSANVYGNCGVTCIDETVTPKPANDYGISKLAMEYMAQLWFDKFPIIITRPFNYTGQGQRDYFVIPKIVNHFISRADSIELGNIDVIREFNDVRSLANIYQQLLLSPVSGEIVNVCSGVGYKLRDVLAYIAKLADHKIKINVNPAFVRKNEIEKLIGDNSKLHQLIGAQQYYSLYDTIDWMFG